MCRACRGAKWLLVSTDDVALSSICTPAPSDGVHSLGAAFCCAPLWQQHRPTAATELVASSQHHLHALMAATAADHMFCVEPEQQRRDVEALAAAPGTPPCQEAMVADPLADSSEPAAEAAVLPPPPHVTAEHWQEVLHTVSMVWAYRARESARQACKVSLVSRGRAAVPGWPEPDSASVATLAAAALGSLAQGVSKTQFMEGRAGYSMCLDLHHLGTRLSSLQLQWLLQDSGEYRCAVRGGQLFGERLVQAPSAPRKRQLAVDPAMACVVAGGTRGLGLQYGQQLVRQGCRALVLTSRSGLLSKEGLIELAQQGGCAGRVGKESAARGGMAGSTVPL